MNVGMIGLGKLGLPVAVAMDLRGLDVMGYDVDPSRMSKRPVRYQEAGPDGDGSFNDYLAKSDIKFGSVEDVVRHSEVVFVAVQTPHHPQYEGVTPLPTTRRDFSYEHLEMAVSSVVDEAKRQEKEIAIAVISTVLPRTMRRRILPLIGRDDDIGLFYTPSFIAMTTTMRDFLNPEFVLIGESGTSADAMIGMADVIRSFNIVLGDKNVDVRCGSYEEIELAKVSYNTFIGFKIAFANTLMEISHRIGEHCDVDFVTDILASANRRLISSAYMTAGMGDGGSCHPRDQIAMSWLARDIGLSCDPFEDLMRWRERQAQWLCRMVMERCAATLLSPFVLGTAYKRECGLEFGSAALLCKNIMRCESWDPYVDAHVPPPNEPHVFLIGMDHDAVIDFKFPRGSVVIDPWRRIEAKHGVPEPDRYVLVSVGDTTA